MKIALILLVIVACALQCLATEKLTEEQEIQKLKKEFANLEKYKDYAQGNWKNLAEAMKSCCGPNKKQVKLRAIMPLFLHFKLDVLKNYALRNETQLGEIKSKQVLKLLIESIDSFDDFDKSFALMAKAVAENKEINDKY